MREITIANEIEYLQEIEKVRMEADAVGNKADLIFRGQNCDKPLRPKIARLYPRGEMLDIERLIIEDFKRYSLPNLEYVPEGDWEWLAVAQHHGLPTRLLDWTYSALTALWFAVKDPVARGKSASVFILSATRDNFKSIESENDPFTIKRTVIYRPKYIERRISSQNGLFTVHKLNEKGVVVDFDNHKSYKQKLTKMLIDSSRIVKIRNKLHMMGINYHSTFPDLDGLSQHLKWRYFKYEDELRPKQILKKRNPVKR
jgi:hypothetical protein